MEARACAWLPWVQDFTSERAPTAACLRLAASDWYLLGSRAAAVSPLQAFRLFAWGGSLGVWLQLRRAPSGAGLVYQI